MKKNRVYALSLFIALHVKFYLLATNPICSSSISTQHTQDLLQHTHNTYSSLINNVYAYCTPWLLFFLNKPDIRATPHKKYR